MIDISQLTALISAFRVETEKEFNVFPEIRFISEIGFAELKVHIKEI